MTRLILLGAAALTLAACGKQGPLAQPAPLFGAKEKAEYAARQRAAADEQIQRDQSQEQGTLPAAPGSTQELENPASGAGTPRMDPLPATQDPRGGTPAGSFPQ